MYIHMHLHEVLFLSLCLQSIHFFAERTNPQRDVDPLVQKHLRRTITITRASFNELPSEILPGAGRSDEWR